MTVDCNFDQGASKAEKEGVSGGIYMFYMRFRHYSLFYYRFDGIFSLWNGMKE